jgi:Acetoacetate decarboxylase (ADC)
MTRPVSVGRAGPRLEAGGVLGATLAANDRRLAEGRLRIEARSETGGFVNALPMLHSRWMPAIDPAAPASMDELVTMSSSDVELGPVYTGAADVRLFEAPGEELAALAPTEMIAGYWRQVGATFAGGERLA